MGGTTGMAGKPVHVCVEMEASYYSVVVIERSLSEVKMGILGELWQFLRERKKWWLLPIILFLLFLGFLMVMTSGSALGPFIYTLF